MLGVAGVLAVTQFIQWRWDIWYRPVPWITASYILQWVGHLIEGNDMGEMILIKKALKKPYVAIAPRYADRDRSAT
jgi:hypothetical protein